MFDNRPAIARAMRFGTKGVHLSRDTEFKRGQPSPAKGIKRPDLAERNKSLEQRLASSRAHKGKTYPPEFGQKISASKRGKSINHLGPTPEVARKISLAHKGKHYSPRTEFEKGHLNPNAGGKMPLEFCQRVRDGVKKSFAQGRVVWNKGIKWEQPWWNDPGFIEKVRLERSKRWENPDYRARVIAGSLKQRRPTGPEAKVIEIIQKYHLPYKYTGNGSFLLEGRRLNPDFVNVNGKKVAIDVFGDYWHTLKADRESYTEDGRKKIFNEYGWHLIVLWETQVNSLSEREIIRLLGGEVWA